MMGNRAQRFSRMSDQELYDEKPTSHNLSFEMGPPRKAKDSGSTVYQQEDPVILRHSPVHNVSYFYLLLIFLAVMTVTILLTAATTVFVTIFFMKGAFISSAEFEIFVNNSHTYMHCAERLDTLEVLLNDTIKNNEDEIAGLKEEIQVIHAAQTETREEIKNIRNITFQQHSDTLELVHFNISAFAQKIHVFEDSMQKARSQDSKELSDSIKQLQGAVDQINTKIHQPVNLYKRCKEDTKYCTIHPYQPRKYWRDCATMSLPLKVEGWETMHYQCMYHSSSTENMEVLTPFEDNGRLHCDCDVTYPDDDAQHHNPVDSNIQATCTLTILRCPLSQAIFD